MLTPRPHPREADRLALLQRCGILDTAPEPDFDGLVALASAIAGTPIALISLIDGGRQWFKARQGLDADQTPRELAFCAHAILGDQPLMVEDARRDPRFAGNPLVDGQPGVVFYAGVPLTAGPDHLPLGTLCVIDRQPRSLPPAALGQLRVLARQVEVLLEARLRQRDLEEALLARARAEPQAALLAKIATQVPGMIFQYLRRADGAAAFVYCSAGSLDIYGFSPEQLVAGDHDVAERIHPDDRDRVRDGFIASAQSLAVWSSDFRYRHPDGRARWLQARGTPERLADGAVVWHGFITDITERKLNEATIEREQARFRLLVEGATDYGIFMLDPDGRVQSWNPGAQRMKGYAAEEIIGRHFSCFYPPEVAASGLCERELAEAARVGRFEDTGWRVRKDGTRFWANVVITPIVSGDGTLFGFTKITRDITERLRAEEVTALLKATFDAANHSIIATAPDGVITVFNAAAERMLGYRADEVVGKATPAILHLPEEMAARAEALAHELGRPVAPGFEVFTARPAQLGVADEREWTYVRKDGHRFPAQLSVTAIRNADGSVRGWLGIASDLTSRKRADAQIRLLKDQLQDAIECLDAGFVMYDADERLVICNRKYREMYRIQPAMSQPGTRYEEVMRLSMRASPEHYRALVGDGDVESWIAGRLDAFRAGRPEPHQHLADRWVQVDEQRTLSGYYISLSTDITALKRMEATARQQAELMRLATTTAGIGMWVFDVAGGGLQWDERMYGIYAYTRADFPGTYAGWRDRLHPDDRQRAEAELQASIAGGASFRCTFRLLLPDGSVRHVAASAAIIADTIGRTTHMVGVNLDITEQVVREARLQQALREQQSSAEEAIAARRLAESAGRAKADFLATMSHEIRTPMNGVIGMTSLLLDTRLSGEQRECVEAIRLSGDALLTVINDILDFSKIEAGKLVIEPIPFDLRTAVEDVIELLGAKAAEKGLDLLLDHPDGVVSRLVGDEGRIRQVLLNLVGNALKFTERGAVVVTVEELSRDDGVARLRLTVSDSGIGMDHEQLGRLFQAFSQADASTSRRFGGTGLGLAICARLCALMGGTIAASSEPGVGSRFIVELPLATDAGDDGSGAGRRAQLRGRRALVVADRQPSGAILERALAAWGMEVASAGDAAGALAALGRWPGPGLLVIDSRSAATAAGLLADIRGACPDLPATPVLLAASGARGDAERMAAAGFRAYLARPLRLATLHQILSAAACAADHERLVTRHSIAEAAGARERRGQHATGAARRGRVLLVEDNSINQKVARSLLERQGCMVDVAGNGAEAVEAAARAPYDLILMDCQMPEMDGFSATRAIRGGAGPCKAAPIVALTANAMQGDREACLAAGMNDHLAKPITAQALAATIDRWLGAAKPPTAPAPRCAGALEELSRHIGGPAAALEVVREFLADIPRYRAELDQRAGADDAPGAGRVLHSLRGSAGILGLVELAHASAAAELAVRAGGRLDLREVHRLLAATTADLEAWLATRP